MRKRLDDEDKEGGRKAEKPAKLPRRRASSAAQKNRRSARRDGIRRAYVCYISLRPSRARTRVAVVGTQVAARGMP